jgi:pimeloyl-ACP methyl ester carboxylesterase
MTVRDFRRPAIPVRFSSIAVLLVVCLAGSGCADIRRILDFKHQEAQAQTIARIDGRIDTEGPVEGNLVVVLARTVEGQDLPLGVDSYVLVNPGSYAFSVSPGHYQVGAYEDRNRNGLLDPDERARLIRDSEILEVGPGEEASLDILLLKGARVEGLTEPFDVLALAERTPGEQRVFSLWAFSVQGEVCEDLDDAKFGPRAGPRGLWQPMDFLNDELAGIYFLEAYDPKRIPVLFVHGISGFPQEFSTLIDALDHERFQAWFYFYPSGFQLDILSDHMARLLKRLQIRHGFDELAIVAHSMGGLVSRGAILKYEDDTKRDDLRLLVSISTPWGGDTRAERAANSRRALPASFRDMSPSSDYLNWLFYEDEERRVVKSLPEESETHMIFSFRMSGSSNIANDGSVTVASQIRFEAQEQALTIRGWNYGHVDILHSREAVERMNGLLDDRF